METKDLEHQAEALALAKKRRIFSVGRGVAFMVPRPCNLPYLQHH